MTIQARRPFVREYFQDCATTCMPFHHDTSASCYHTPSIPKKTIPRYGAVNVNTWYDLSVQKLFLVIRFKRSEDMQSYVRDALSNIRGGLVGVLICLIITALVYGTAFMIAFGNDTHTARAILAFAEVFFMVANPLWTIPISYFLGGCFLFTDRSSTNREDRR